MDDNRGPVQAVAFTGQVRVAAGDLRDVALALHALSPAAQPASVLVLEAATGRPIDLDLRGTPAEVAERLEGVRAGSPEAGTNVPDGAASPESGVRAPRDAESADSRRGPGRPRLGVVAREVTLLPRHWEWLNAQPGGASVTLRKLVEEAKRRTADEVRVREARDATYRFMHALAGDEPGYEEALRALYAGRRADFEQRIAPWPRDVREHVVSVADAAF